MSHAYDDEEFPIDDLYRKLDEAESSLRKNPRGISHETVMKELHAKLQRPKLS